MFTSRLVLAVALVALGACNSTTTLFQSSFNSQQTFAPPAATQLVGTMQLISGDSGMIQIDDSPVLTSKDHWLRIRRLAAAVTNNGTAASVVQGTLAQTFPDGTYGFLGAFVIGQGSGVASVEFDANPQGPTAESFLHLDFMQNGTVRFDDDPAAICCHYSPDSVFTLSVSFQPNANPVIAHVNLFGKGVSQGSFDYPIKYPNLVSRFSAFRLWMGVPWTGDFWVTDLLVTRHN